MGLQRKTRDRIEDLVHKRAIFKIVNIAGSKYPEAHGYGQLPFVHVNRMKEANPTYVVYSYETPIAWLNTTGWVVPHILYSVTTSHHQSLMRVIVMRDHYSADIQTETDIQTKTHQSIHSVERPVI